MSKKFVLYWGFLLVWIFSIQPELSAQSLKKLTLDEVLALAKSQSPQAIMAKHRFLGKYWEYRTYQAKYRPSLSTDVTLADFNRSLEKEYDFTTGEEQYVEKNSNNMSVGLNLQQNVGLTGGAIFAQSEFRRFDRFGANASKQYITVPASIGFRQPVFAYNPLKWEREIEPLKYKEAKKSFLDDMEAVNQRAVNLFFNLALAQLNVEIAKFNYSNADTLYRIAQGRFNIGTIAEDELLQMQLTFLNAGTALNESQIDLQVQQFQLRSFLGFNDKVNIELLIPNEIPDLEIDVQSALTLATQNNPDIMSFERQLVEAQRDVAMAKGNKGINANIFASLGYTGSADNPSGAYQNLLDQQRINVGFSLPIVEWGLGRGQYKMALSNQEVVKTTVQQSKTDFQQTVFLSVAQFNIQDDQLMIAAKADTIAMKRYEVTKQRFLIGKITVLDLNVADSEKDIARRNYISALRNYWADFYNVRRLTLHDFTKKQDIGADFESLIQ